MHRELLLKAKNFVELTQRMQAEQRYYFRLKREFGNATQQLEVCKKYEKLVKETGISINQELDKAINLLDNPQQKSLF